MSILAEPSVIIVGATDRTQPRTPLAVRPGRRSGTVRIGVPSRRSQPFTTLASTEELLRQRDQLPPEHPDRAKIRARAIEMNLPLARHLARRYAGRGEPLDDLSQVAALALINAVDRYDSRRQIPFTAFAVPSILGVLKRHFRDTTWSMRVPRPIQDLASGVPAAAEALSQRWGRTPTAAELAAYMHATVDDVQAALGARQNYHLASLNRQHDSGVDVIDTMGSVDPGYAGVDDYLLIRPVFAQLPLRDRRILTMRFYDHMTQTQIAAEIGMSQMHVSRLLRQSLDRLRAAMRV